MRILIGALGGALLAGCATSPVPLGEAVQAPSERVTGYQKPVEGGGTVIVVRDRGFVGSGCYATVFLNGKPVARLDTKEKASFYVPAGHWTLGARVDGEALCSLGNERLEDSVIVEPGQTKKYRIYTSSEGEVGIKASTF
ncbi:TPA: hypothetical protein U8203_005102 [Pseudomonas putida]|nr:hypothetical protein [Pseudomonas putida]HEN8719723.1 hypothetical protein [Pseudomonas putida]